MFLASVGIKGGVAKTSTAVTLATYMHRQGESVALLDADPQGTAARWCEGFGSPFPVVTVDPTDDARGATLDAIGSAFEQAEHVVADCPPSSTETLRSLLGVADLAIVPAGPNVEELHLASTVAAMADQESRHRRGDPVRCAIVLARIDTRTTVGRDALALIGDLGAPVCETVLRQRTAWPEAMSAAIPIFDLPPSKAAEAIREAEALCAELLAFAEKDPEQ